MVLLISLKLPLLFVPSLTIMIMAYHPTSPFPFLMICTSIFSQFPGSFIPTFFDTKWNSLKRKANNIGCITVSGYTTLSTFKITWPRERKLHIIIKTFIHSFIPTLMTRKTGLVSKTANLILKWFIIPLWLIMTTLAVLHGSGNLIATLGWSFSFWKIFHNGLPVIDNLCKRNVPIPNFCPLCGNQIESIEHLFRFCPSSLHVRPAAGFNKPDNPDTPFLSWLKHEASSTTISPSLHIPMGTLFTYILWHLWIARNKKTFECQTFSPHITLSSAVSKAQEFHFLAAKSNQKLALQTCYIGWSPPPPSLLKINTDGAFNQSSNLAANGGIIRDHKGFWVMGFSKFLGFESALLAELWAIKTGLSMCLNKGFLNIIFETDSKLAASLILDNNLSCNHHLYPLIISCRSDLTALHSSIYHIHREGNACAWHFG